MFQHQFSSNDPNLFFLVVEGAIEISAILPTIRKKTVNIREFLCKKDVGDMVYMPSVRKLISESNAKDMFEREDAQEKNHMEHKNILELIDSVTIRSTAPSTTILQLDWVLFDKSFPVPPSVLSVNASIVQEKDVHRTQLDVEMLRSIMKTNLSDYLEAIPILEGLPHSKKELLARLCRYSIAKEGTVICREGDVGEEVFLLIHGQVKVETMVSERVLEIIQNDRDDTHAHDGTQTTISSDLDSSIRRKASVTYKSDYYEPGACEMLSKGMSNLFRNRKTLIKARDDCKREGLSLDNKEHFIELSRFGPGEYFGEVATFVNLPRTATVTATKNSILASLSSTSFKTLYDVIKPHLKADVEFMVKHHMLHSLLQSKSPFLESSVISENQMKKMAEKLEIVVFAENTVVFYEGDESDRFYFVYSGQLNLQKNRKKTATNGPETIVVGMLYSGDYFGEIALIDASKRLATITTKSKTVLLALRKDHFHQCFQETPALIQEFNIRIKGKKVSISDILDYPVMKDLLGEYLSEAKRREYLDCLADILIFEKACKEATNSKEKNLSEKASQLMDTYLKKTGSNPLDISATVANDVKFRVSKYLERCRRGDPSNTNHLESVAVAVGDDPSADDLFTQLKTAILSLLDVEIMPKFKVWPPFDLMLKRLRAYDDETIEQLA